jgi:hypothetical protein
MAQKTRLRHQAPRQSTLDGSYRETGMGGPRGSIAGGGLDFFRQNKTIKTMKEKVKIACLVLITIAILVAVGFYCWSIWEEQEYFKIKRRQELPSLKFPDLPSLKFPDLPSLEFPE